tara:strand:+ start:1303 stop:2175 length:873 start_codon:yes stop_codon:yes gene_type:complete
MKADIKERLKFLELCLLLLGEFKKGYFHLLFDTQKAQHRKDLRAYEEECNDNIEYDKSLKRYLPTREFTPKFLPDNPQALLAYQKYVDDLIASSGEVSPFHQVEHISQPFLTAPNIDIWAVINRAITRKQVLSINYSGLRKQESHYNIQALALVHNGFRWHVRAYVVGENRYRDFVLSRMNQYHKSALTYDASGALDNDDKWNDTVELVFKPHPNLTPEQVQSVAEDYGMTNGKKTVECKACNIQHILKATRTGLDLDQQEAHLFPIILDYKGNDELMLILQKLKQQELI